MTRLSIHAHFVSCQGMPKQGNSVCYNDTGEKEILAEIETSWKEASKFIPPAMQFLKKYVLHSELPWLYLPW